MDDRCAARRRSWAWPVLTVTAALAVAVILGRFASDRGPAWAFVKLLLALGLMVLLLRERAPIFLSLFVGAITLGVSFRLSAGQLFDAFSFGLRDRSATSLHELGMGAVRLGVMVTLINLMGRLLIESGGIRRLTGALERLFRDSRYALAGVPAMIGLLPMPAGALMSAPMVNDIGDRLALTPAQKTLANYWFRHVWEWWWPIYPAILLVLDGGYLRSMPQLLRYMAPFTLLAIALGWIILVRRIPRPARPARGNAWRELGRLLSVAWPVLAVVAGAMLIPLPRAYQPWLLPALLPLVNFAYAVVARLPAEKIRIALVKALQWEIMLLVVGIYILRGVFELSGAAEQLPQALAAFHVPAMGVCFIVPCSISAVTGYNLAGVSMAFPLLAPLFAVTGPAGVAVAYAGSFLGILATPVHLCLALTREYFHAEWGSIYAGLALLLAGMLAATALLACFG